MVGVIFPMIFLFFYCKANPISNQRNEKIWGCEAFRALIELILFGIYIYSTKLFHYGQGDGNWRRKTHKGVTKSRHTDISEAICSQETFFKLGRKFTSDKDTEAERTSGLLLQTHFGS